MPAEGTAGGKSLVQGQVTGLRTENSEIFLEIFVVDHSWRNPASKHLSGKGMKLSKLLGEE